MSIAAVTRLSSVEAIYQQIAARQAPQKSRPAGTTKESARSNEALRAARQASGGAGSSHSEKSEVNFRAYA